MQTHVSNEALSLRKLRELSGLDRKQAGIKLGVSHKTIEKFENGRSQLSPTKVGEILRGYDVPQDDFEHVLNGRFDAIREKYAPKRMKIIEHKRECGRDRDTKRSDWRGPCKGRESADCCSERPQQKMNLQRRVVPNGSKRAALRA